MDDPDAKDEEWLAARERGEDIGRVLAAKRAPYEQLGALIGAGRKPSAGWKERVLAAIDAEEEKSRLLEPVLPVPEPELAPIASLEQRRRPPWRRRLWIAGGIAAAAAVILLVGPRLWSGPPQPQLIALESEVRKGGTVVRGDSGANVGDTLVVHAEAIGAAEIRVYGGSSGRLIATCKDQGGDCTIERDGERRRFTLEVKLKVPGIAQAVIFLGANLPVSGDSLALDLEAAASARIPSKQTPVRRVL
jgi:hypothetical protein